MSRRADLQQQLLAAVQASMLHSTLSCTKQIAGWFAPNLTPSHACAHCQTLNTLSTQFVSIVNELQTAALETPAQVNVQPVEGTTMMEQLREELQGADPPEEEAMMEECRKELRRPLRIYVA
eukprot:862552-Amphidinium_carterae.1